MLILNRRAFAVLTERGIIFALSPLGLAWAQLEAPGVAAQALV